MNGIDLGEHVTGGRVFRAARRFARATPTFLGITDKHLVVRAPGNFYFASAATVLIARSIDARVELAWIWSKRPDLPGYPEKVPQGEFADSAYDLYCLGLDVDDRATAQQIVQAVTAVREKTLALVPAADRTELERMAGAIGHFDLL